MKGVMGDAHFFEESMNIEKIRKLLDNKLGVAGHSEKLEAMKSLLASMSKGEDVSIFFADVVKNVIVASVEVKKLVYMYLVHYADANAQCRELALLSINSFQKDLADPNQLIRALALRVMTSIRVRDILQIQLIAIRKCAADSSPYVRKCAANAISKIYIVDRDQKDVLADIIGNLLQDSSTMVLGSAMQALHEVCPDRLDLLHQPFRKICHLLADIDEWGQTVTINVLMRYCREQFQSPERLLPQQVDPASMDKHKKQNAIKELFPKRKVHKGFYSDEEDEEDGQVHRHGSARGGSRGMPSSSGFGAGPNASPFHLGGGPGPGGSGAGSGGGSGQQEMVPSVGSVFRSYALASGASGGEELDEDHRLLLRSSIPLLKSRNSAVVLAVSTLHYYCGTHSMATSTLIGKSLVRIMRNQREIQFVVLSVISSMANSRPDMFLPFLQDFFVRATDPSYARKLKLEILTSLVTEENVSIILREFQAYVRHVDKQFVTMTIRALGRVADAMPSVAERCLHGLMRLVRSSNEQVVAESVVVIRQLLQQKNVEKDAVRVVRSLAAMMTTKRVTSASARASIVWMLGEFSDAYHHQNAIATETLRILVKDFAEEATEVRLQLLNLAVKLTLRDPQKQAIQLLLQYVIELCRFDPDYDVRDRTRLIRAALASEDGLLNPHTLFLSVKPAPLIGNDEEKKRRFTLGTLSDIVRHSVVGYQALPAWREEKPDRSLRDEVSSFMEDSSKMQSSRTASKRSRGDPQSHRAGGSTAQDFYSEESSEEEGSETGSESESELGSESGSGSGSGSEYDSDSDASASSGEDRSEAESGSEEESESEQSESDEDSRRHRNRRHHRKASSSSPKRKTMEHQPLVSTSPAVAPAKPLDLFDPLNYLNGSGAPSAPQSAPISSMGMGMMPASTNSLLNDFSGLNMGASSGLQMGPMKRMLLSAEEGNGLEIEYSFLRQPSMYNAKMNVVQLWLMNRSKQPISRISVTCPDEDGKVVSFGEIAVLFPDNAQPTMAQMHVDFNNSLNAVALEFTTGEGISFETSLNPFAGELLMPQQLNLEDFNRRLAQLNPGSLCTSQFMLQMPVQFQSLVDCVVRTCAVAQVYEINNMMGQIGRCKFAGRLRSDNQQDPTMIVVIALEFHLHTGKTSLLVGCDQPALGEVLGQSIQAQLPTK